MLLNLAKLKGLSVFSQSGLRLGQVVDLEIDSDTQSILRYLVQRGRLVGRFQEPLLIHRSQVISISSERMVVEDAVAKLAAEARAKASPAPQPAAI